MEGCRCDNDQCGGEVEYRLVESITSVTGYRSYPYCDYHWEKRLQQTQKDKELLSDVSPPWFDPMDEDY